MLLLVVLDALLDALVEPLLFFLGCGRSILFLRTKHTPNIVARMLKKPIKQVMTKVSTIPGKAASHSGCLNVVNEL